MMINSYLVPFIHTHTERDYITKNKKRKDTYNVRLMLPNVIYDRQDFQLDKYKAIKGVKEKKEKKRNENEYHANFFSVFCLKIDISY